MAASPTLELKWSAQFVVSSPASARRTLRGDKIVLPPSALEGLLAAAPTAADAPAAGNDYLLDGPSRPATAHFDPLNPYTYAAERAARAYLHQQQQQQQPQQPQLPHPLTFRLVNPRNGRVVYAGITEFSAAEGEIGLSPFLRRALGLATSNSPSASAGATEHAAKRKEGSGEAAAADTQDKEAVPVHDVDVLMTDAPQAPVPAQVITVHARPLPKGTSVRLRPLAAGYDVDDWKALLEQHLRANYTTLTSGEVLTVPAGAGGGSGRRRNANNGDGDADADEHDKGDFRFLIDQLEPTGDGICVVDTDLEVDIAPLDEEQARETLQRRLAKSSSSSSSPSYPGGVARGGAGPGSAAIVDEHGGGSLEMGRPSRQGLVEQGAYVDYQLAGWDRSQGIEVELDRIGGDGDDDDGQDAPELDLFVSPLSARQRARPRDDQHVFGDFSSEYPKRLRIAPTNVALDKAEAVWVSVHAYTPPAATAESGDHADDSRPRRAGKSAVRTARFQIVARSIAPAAAVPVSVAKQGQEQRQGHEDELQCKNCEQWVPRRTMMLHENFCFRQNVLCRRGCGQVFKKNSREWAHHWHCTRGSGCSTTTTTTTDVAPSDLDGAWGNSRASAAKHDDVSHTARACPSCAGAFRATSLPQLAHHRTSLCPGKLIICQFCHLLVPQGSPNDDDDDDGDGDGNKIANDRGSNSSSSSDMASGGDANMRASFLLSDLTPHEYRDGARTTECHLCGRFVRLRDMATHLRHHDYERRRRRRPRACRNANCSNIVDRGGIAGAGGAGAGVGAEAVGGGSGTFGLCSVCFGPLYVSMYDPDGRALRRRVERRYLSQLLSGCGKAWCRNAFCKTGHARAFAPVAALPLPPPSPLSSTPSTHLSSKPSDQNLHAASPPFALPRNTKDAAALVKPFVDAFTTHNATLSTSAATTSTSTSSPLHFCVDERRQNLRALAENMVMMMAPTADGAHPNDDAGHQPTLSSFPSSSANALHGSSPSPDSSSRPQYVLEWCLCALEAVISSSSSSSTSSSSAAKHDADDADDDDADPVADNDKGKESGEGSGVGGSGSENKGKDTAGRAEAAVIERAWRWLQDWAPTLREEQETQR